MINLFKQVKLLPAEKLTLGYCLLTSVLVVIIWPELDNPLVQLTVRGVIAGSIAALGYVSVRFFKDNRLSRLFRILFQIALLSYWYPDTYEFNKLFPNLDPFFASIEQSLFGMQPAVEFAQHFSRKWFSEAVHMGYFAYYPMIVGTTLFCFFTVQKDFNRFAYLLIGAFFVYYLIFIFLPVAGPQYYFQVLGPENVKAANFVSIDDYFRYNYELISGPGHSDGFFYRLVELTQKAGERPTAAFPSSHVGISTILLLWAWRYNKKYAAAILPFYFLLCCATVYIQAHYLIDVLGGWATGAGLYFAFYGFRTKRMKLLDRKFNRPMPKIHNGYDK